MPRSALARVVVPPQLVRPASAPPNLSGARTDAAFVQKWLENKSASPNTRAAYAADANLFVACMGKRGVRYLGEVMVDDFEAFKRELEGAPSTRARRVASIKSLFSFGIRTGYLLRNVTVLVNTPKVPSKLAARILPAEDIHRLLVAAADGRDAAMLRLLYVSGIRVSEVCALTWGDLHERGDAAVLTTTGKGEKTRHILLTARLWEALQQLRPADVDDTAPVFPSRTGRHLDRTAVLRIVRATAKAAKIKKPVSPHWFRHAHASHSLDRGAPVNLVQATLGHASLATTSRYTHAKPNDSSGRYLDA